MATLATSGCKIQRLYWFYDNNAFMRMINIMRQQKEKHHLEIKVYIRKPREAHRPDDLSLLFMPISNHTSSWEENHENGFSPLCGMTFHVKAQQTLNTMKILPGNSISFRQKYEHFKHWWRIAMPLDNAIDDAQ